MSVGLEHKAFYFLLLSSVIGFSVLVEKLLNICKWLLCATTWTQLFMVDAQITRNCYLQRQFFFFLSFWFERRNGSILKA